MSKLLVILPAMLLIEKCVHAVDAGNKHVYTYSM
jgi:hypothetical protein